MRTDRPDVASELWRLLDSIDAGRVKAGGLQREYLGGVAVAVAGLAEFDDSAIREGLLDCDPLGE